MTDATPPLSIDGWLDALLRRHMAALTRSEFLKAVRALSARYVEQRRALPDRSPLDSAGKRAAFAAFFAPLHFFTARAVIEALGPSVAAFDDVLDLGCGTGVVGAAIAVGRPCRVTGIDQQGWALKEADWNWRMLGIDGRTRRGDLHSAIAARRPAGVGRRAIVFGWSLNELTAPERARLHPQIDAAVRAGDTVLILEPLAKTAVPWWDAWREALAPLGARADEWRLPNTLPAALRALDAEAGFRRDALGARSLVIPGLDTPGPDVSRRAVRGGPAESATVPRE